MSQAALSISRVLFATAVVSVLTAAAQAHPHILPNVRTSVMFDAGERLTAIHHTWTYDKAYSTFAVRDIDSNKDGEVSKVELDVFAKRQIDALAEHNYFTTVTLASGEDKFGTVESYSIVKLEDGRLELDFTLLLKNPGTLSKQATVEIYDPNFFAYFTMTSTDVRLVGAPQGCAPTVAGPEPIDLKNTRGIPDVFWQALRGSKTAGLQFVNRITIQCL